jgi:hypothetical protein
MIHVYISIAPTPGNPFGTISSEHPGPDDDSAKGFPPIFTASSHVVQMNRPSTSRLSDVRCTPGSDLIGFPEYLRSFNGIERIGVTKSVKKKRSPRPYQRGHDRILCICYDSVAKV